MPTRATCLGAASGVVVSGVVVPHGMLLNLAAELAGVTAERDRLAADLARVTAERDAARAGLAYVQRPGDMALAVAWRDALERQWAQPEASS